MNYRRFKPSAAVSRFVEFYWTLEDKSQATGNQIVIPDGRSGIIINFATPFQSNANGAWIGQPECFFVGQITGPLLLRAAGPSGMIGIQFRPHGAAHLLEMPMHEVTDSAVALEHISRRLFRALEGVRDLPTLARAVGAIDPILHAFAKNTSADFDSITQAIQDIERTSGLISIDDVANRIGLSTRQLQRRFAERVGISPKLFSRMQRFQGVLRTTEDPSANWVTAAIHNGYYDQAHLIRDFRQFSGKPPTALLDRELDFTRRFVERRPLSHLSNTTKRTSH